MGFFLLDSKPGNKPARGPSDDFLRRHGCQACPLNYEPGLRHPKMEPTGSERPLVYCIGEAPGEDEDRKGVQFVGRAGRVLRFRIPPEWEKRIRWSNTVHCRPPGNREPTEAEATCCRPRIEQDIERTKPKAIFGFGNVSLRSFLNQGGITLWNGRRVPVKVGSHVCWYFPMLHPSFIARIRKFEPRNRNQYGSDWEFVFAHDLKQAFDQIEHLPEPVVHAPADIHKGCEFVTSSGGWGDVERIEQFLQSLHECPSTGIDYETNCYRPYAAGAKILTVALSSSQGTMAFPLRHRGAKWEAAQLQKVETLYRDFLYRYRGRRIAHSLAFEMEWSAFFYGKEVLRAGRWDDTLAQAFILDMGGRGRESGGKDDEDKATGGLSLDFLCLNYFGIRIKPHDLDRGKLDDAPLQSVLRYNGPDAKYARLLYLPQARRLKEDGLSEVYEHHLRRIPTMVLTQMKGLPISRKTNEKLAKKYNGEIARIEKEIEAHPDTRKFRGRIGASYRPSAPPDTIRFCKDILGKELENSTEFTLSKVKHPVVQNTLDYRKVAKQLSTYVVPVSADNLYPDGLIHFVLNTCKVRSWRTSCIRKGTLIQIPGGSKPIEDIRVGDLVYTYDDERKLTLRKVTNTWYNGRKKLVRVYWSSRGGCSGFIDVTPDHRFRLINGKYKAAQFLQGAELDKFGRVHRAKDRILALRRGTASGYNILYATNARFRECRFVFTDIYGWSPEHVHHKDHCKTNDDPDNLEGLSVSDHHKEHITVEITREQLLVALKKGNGVSGAARYLGCDYSTVINRLEKFGLIPVDGRTIRKVRLERRKPIGPYKGHADYVSGYRPKAYNHVIRKVEELEGLHPVYDLAIDGSPCFIANELCVHNSDSPNIQNWSKHDNLVLSNGTEWPTKEVRSQLRAPVGHKIVAFDYAGIQARNVAMESQDPTLVQNFWDKYDIHSDWMEQIAELFPAWVKEGRKAFLAKPYKDNKVRKAYRQRAKNEFVFATFFGAQPFKVSKTLGIPIEHAETLQHRFLKERFPEIDAWHKKLKHDYYRDGYVTGLSGFRRRAPVSVNQLINYPIQADEAIIVCDAMCRLSEKGEDAYQASLEVHDDLTFLWPKDKIDQYAEVVIGTMLGSPFEWINVPLGVEMSVGDDWSELKSAGEYFSNEWSRSERPTLAPG